MDFVPLIPRTDVPCLSDGVMVFFEEHDVAGVLDFLSFLISHKELHKKEIHELPQIFVNGTDAEPENLFAHLSNIFPDGEGKMNTQIVIQILDDDREFFGKYLNHLEDLVLTDDREPEKDTDHPLCKAYETFAEIEFDFFPAIEDMH